MSDSLGNIMLCNCGETMPLDGDLIRRSCHGSPGQTAHQLCRAELGRFQTLARDSAPLTVACTQEARLFTESAAEVGRTAPINFVNIRETAGWSDEADSAGPKIAALLAASAEPLPQAPSFEIESSGVVLIYGHGESAVEAGNLLKGHLDVTVLIKPPVDITPPGINDFPIVKGVVRAARGHLGAFEVTVDDFAQPLPSSRRTLEFSPARHNAVSRCDVIVDLSGDAPLFPAADLRDGYLRADAGNPAAVLAAVLKARDLVGSFDKLKYIAFTDSLCAHSRSKITGCTRCLDLCPAGAIAPAGDHVVVDPNICAGCGQCAAACPTGAASYTLPTVDALIRKLRILMTTYREAGGKDAIVLLHDSSQGTPLIEALARFGDGLPANVLPVSVNEVTQIGLETVAALFSYGASAVRLLLRARPRHDITGLTRMLALAEPILTGLGFGAGRLATLETDDPLELGELLRAIPAMAPVSRPSSFLALGDKRSVLRFAMRELHEVSPEPTDVIPLPSHAPFGAIEVDTDGCTMCLSCVSACPTGALSDDPERPLLRFSEVTCIQCGLCKATCPEKVISLVPRINFNAGSNGTRILNEEEPFGCIRCGKAFGVKSTIERIIAKLAGSHWMYKDSPERLELIKMCDDCRVAVITEGEFDPHAPPRPPVRTTDDYLREAGAEGEGPSDPLASSSSNHKL